MLVVFLDHLIACALFSFSSEVHKHKMLPKFIVEQGFFFLGSEKREPFFMKNKLWGLFFNGKCEFICFYYLRTR
jgi:hypothetical protein